MTPRERYVTALNCGTPDRVPVGDYLFSLNLQKRLLGTASELYDPPTQLKLAEMLGIDTVWVGANGFCGFEETPHREGEHYQDEWGVTYIKNGWPVMVQIDTPIKSRDDWQRYKLPRPDAPHRLNMLRVARKANAANIAIQAGFLGPFTMMYWYLMDLETLSLTIYDDPSLVHEMVQAYVNWALDVAVRAVDLGGIDAFSISDDWGGTRSLLMSPAHLREFFMPAMHKLVQGMRQFGLPVILHNDGAIWPMLDDLVETGINALHPIERLAGGDLSLVKNRYRRKICPIGNVDNKYVMCKGTPEDVRKEVLNCLQIAKPFGGYILSTDHSIHDGMPYENILAYLETAHEHGVYE